MSARPIPDGRPKAEPAGATGPVMTALVSRQLEHGREVAEVALRRERRLLHASACLQGLLSAGTSGNADELVDRAYALADKLLEKA